MAKDENVSGCLVVGCCLGAICLFLCPRIILFGTWVFSDYLSVYETWFIPLLGFFFLPWTTLAYALALHHGGLQGEWILLFVIALVADVGAYFGLRR